MHLFLLVAALAAPLEGGVAIAEVPTNQPPSFFRDGVVVESGGHAELPVIDPEGDPLQLELVGAPNGFEVEGTVLHAGVAPGTHLVSVLAEDGHGGWTQGALEVHVRAAPATASCATAPSSGGLFLLLAGLFGRRQRE